MTSYLRSSRAILPTTAVILGVMIGAFQNCSHFGSTDLRRVEPSVTSLEREPLPSELENRPPIGSWYWENSGRRAILVGGNDEIQLFDWPERLKNPMRLARLNVSELQWSMGDAQVLSYKGALFQRARNRNISDGERFDTWCVRENDDVKFDLRLMRADHKGQRRALLMVNKTGGDGYQRTASVSPGKNKNSLVAKGIELEIGASGHLKVDRDPQGETLEEPMSCVGRY